MGENKKNEKHTFLYFASIVWQEKNVPKEDFYTHFSMIEEEANN